MAFTIEAETATDTTQTETDQPTYGTKKKKGAAWLCPLIVIGCVIFFIFFLLKKLYMLNK